jgi:glucosamine-6-phosphate deaminase
MKVIISENSIELGKTAAARSAEIINEAIARQGKARIVLSTGMSQFETIKA